MNIKNMNRTEKLIYLLNNLRISARDDERKKYLGELLNKLEIKVGKIPTEL